MALASDGHEVVTKIKLPSKLYNCCWNVFGNDSLTLYKGLFYALLSSAFLSLCAIIVKTLKEVGASQISLYRFTGILVISLPILVYKNVNVFGEKADRFYLVGRSVFGTSHICFAFLAFKYLQVSEASVIVFSFPVFVPIFAKIFLKEDVGYYQAFAIVTTIIGLVVTSKVASGSPSNSPDGNRFIGMSSAFASVVFSVIAVIFLRKLKNTNEHVTLFTYSLCGIVITSVITACLEGFTPTKCGFHGWFALLLGIFGFLGQFFFTSAMRQEQAVAVSTVRASGDIALTLLWELIILKTVPEPTSVVGAVLVCFSIVLIGIHKHKLK